MKRFAILLVLLLVASGAPVGALTKVPVGMVDGDFPWDRLASQPVHWLTSASYASMSAAIASGGYIILPQGVEDYSGTITNAAIAVGTNTHLLGYGATLSASGNVFSPLVLRVDQNNSRIVIDGLTILGNRKTRRGINIYTATGVTGGSVIVKNCKIMDLHGSASSTESVLGISVDGNFDTISITGNTIASLSSEAGVLARQAIGVSTRTANTTITGNSVSRIRAVSDVDADGVIVFSKEHSAAAVGASETFPITISGNHFVDCEGRGVKLQATGANVSGNTFEHISGSSITNAVYAVDAQTGGVTATNNRIKIHSGATVGGSAKIFSAQCRIGEDQNFNFSNNSIYTERPLPYGIIVSQYADTLNVSSATISFNDNQFTNAPSMYVSNHVYLSATGSLVMLPITVEASRNKVIGGNGLFFRLSGTYWSNSPERAASLTAILTDNSLQEFSGSFYYVADVATPSLPYLKMAGNNISGSNFGVTGVCSLDRILPGSSFYYGTNGGTGGITDAPSGYTRYVWVQRGDTHVTLSQSTTTQSGLTGYKSSGTWYFPTMFTGNVGYTTASATLGTFTFSGGYLQSVTVP